MRRKLDKVGSKEDNMNKIFSFLVITLVLLGTSIYAGGDEEDQLLNTNSCVNCDLNNAWLEKAKLRDARFSNTKTDGIRF